MASLMIPLRSRLPTVTVCTVRSCTRSLSTTTQRRRQGPGTGENFQQANDPTDRKLTPNVSQTNEMPVSAMGAKDTPLQETAPNAEKQRSLQAPNRAKPWSRSQMPREVAMSGPRFEQTIMEAQPQPFAAIELIHKQPVRWMDSKSVSCDGGGGPLGHPRIFINLDKPQVCWCTYCGLPYANTHNRKAIEASGRSTYPLVPTGDPAEVEMPRTPTQKGEIQGHYPILKGEVEAAGVNDKAFSQR